jgi:stringent starvation protein B
MKNTHPDLPSTKPYLVRALHEWCHENGFTPYLTVLANEHAKVPKEFVKEGQITLNVSHEATNQFAIQNDAVSFSARFAGAVREIWFPTANILAIYARENGVGMAFQAEKYTPPDPLSSFEIEGSSAKSAPKKDDPKSNSFLKVVK